MEVTDRQKELAEKIGKERNCDVFFYAGYMGWPDTYDFAAKIGQIAQRSNNCLLILSTYGGDPNQAYKLTRQIHRQYPKLKGAFTLLIGDVCKSAGTLVALGADELVMADMAEMGPLDVQVRSREEIGEYSSGLVSMQALSFLENESLRFFKKHWGDLHESELKEGLSFPTKLAAHVATQDMTGLFGHIYSQLDPNRLGELQRAILLGIEYGNRLCRGNAWQGSVEALVIKYPAHGFVIDIEEAGRLFCRVRRPDQDETNLLNELTVEMEERSGVTLVRCACLYSRQAPAQTDDTPSTERGQNNDPQQPPLTEQAS